MGIFDIFTGQPAIDAANQTKGYIAGQQQAVDARLAAAQAGGLAALQSGQYGALGAVQPAIAQGRADIYGATPQATGAVANYGQLGAAALAGSQDPALGALYGSLGAVGGAYQPLQDAATRYGAAGGAAQDMTANALGLRGPEGTAAARAAFEASPGYQFQLTQGLDSLTRAANAAGGGTAGGNVLTEAQKYGSGLAQQEFDKWRTALQGQQNLYSPLEANALSGAAGGLSQAALTGGTGAANIYTGTGQRLADLYSTTGRALAPIYQGQGTSLADLAKTGGLTEANIYTGTGQQEANLYAQLAGLGTKFAGETLKPYGEAGQMAASAAIGGSKNLWDLAGGIGKAGLGFFA